MTVYATQEQKDKMTRALSNLQDAVFELGNLWDGSIYNNSKSEQTPFDKVLEKNYPFENSYLEVVANISEWVEESIEAINKRTKLDRSKLDVVVKYNNEILEKVNFEIDEAEGLITFQHGEFDIHNPFFDHSLRYEVDPLEEYGIGVGTMIDEYERRFGEIDLTYKKLLIKLGFSRTIEKLNVYVFNKDEVQLVVDHYLDKLTIHVNGECTNRIVDKIEILSTINKYCC